MKSLKNLRKQFDAIDEEIISLMAQRMELSNEMGQLKQQENLPIQDSDREMELMKKLKKNARFKGVSESFIIQLYEMILKESRRIQEST